jgi:hypothetical protein
MNTMRANILNPKAARLMKDLGDLNPIAIQVVSKSGFVNVLKKNRSKEKSTPSLEEIEGSTTSLKNHEN